MAQLYENHNYIRIIMDNPRLAHRLISLGKMKATEGKEGDTPKRGEENPHKEEKTPIKEEK